MEGKWPLVTVFTLIYNTNPGYIIEAIQSVKENHYPNLQHIIIDDCSLSPVPKETVKKWIEDNDYKCEFYEHEVNYGICKTLNHVLELAKGKYILGCCDDLITKDRLYNDVVTFEMLGENYAIVFGLSQEISSDSQLQPRILPYFTLAKNDNYWEMLIEKNIFSAPSLTYRTWILKKIGGFNEMVKFEDYEMLLRLSKLGYKFKNLPRINSYYRIHESNISKTLNFKLENIRILSFFGDCDTIKKIMFKKVWSMAYYKDLDFEQAIGIYENLYSKNFKLKLTRVIHNKRILNMLNRFFKISEI